VTNAFLNQPEAIEKFKEAILWLRNYLSGGN